jgi:hypothetical protein
MRFRPFLYLLLFALVILTAAGRADTIYTYTGNPLNQDISQGNGYCHGCSIGIVLDFANPLAPNLALQTVTPVSYTFSAGGTTVTNATPFWNLISSQISTDSLGNIVMWDLTVFRAQESLGISSRNFPGVITDLDESGSTLKMSSFNQNNPGSWTASSSSPVPEPSSMLLLGVGLIGGIGAMRRKVTK